MKNQMSGLLMEVGAEYNKKQLHGERYFTELLGRLEEVPESVKELLRVSRSGLEMFEATQEQLLRKLRKEPLLSERVERLQSIDGVGEVTALTWALEVGDPQRLSSVGRAVSYCGLIEAGKLAPRWNPQLAAVHEREVQRGHRNRATPAVARKLVAYLLAVDKSGQPFQPRSAERGPSESSWATGSVSRPAGLPKFNLRGRLVCCSRKWMSGHALALARYETDRHSQTAARSLARGTASQEALSKGIRRSVFSLDKPLSWMSLFAVCGRSHSRS